MSRNQDPTLEAFPVEVPEDWYAHKPWLERPRDVLKRTWEQLTHRPPVNLFRHNGDLVLEASLPGLDRSDIDVVVTAHDVTIRARPGEHRLPADCFCHEFSPEPVSRHLDLPVEVDGTRTRAEYSHGVLRLTMPLSAADAHATLVPVD